MQDAVEERELALLDKIRSTGIAPSITTIAFVRYVRDYRDGMYSIEYHIRDNDCHGEGDEEDSARSGARKRRRRRGSITFDITTRAPEDGIPMEPRLGAFPFDEAHIQVDSFSSSRDGYDVSVTAWGWQNLSGAPCTLLSTLWMWSETITSLLRQPAGLVIFALFCFRDVAVYIRQELLWRLGPL